MCLASDRPISYKSSASIAAIKLAGSVFSWKSPCPPNSSIFAWLARRGNEPPKMRQLLKIARNLAAARPILSARQQKTSLFAIGTRRTSWRHRLTPESEVIDGVDAMKPQKRSFSIAGHRTSISLEAPFWDALKELSASADISMAELVARIDHLRDKTNLSSAVRIHILAHYRAASVWHPAHEEKKSDITKST